MKKVLVHGFSMNNLGDDLFFIQLFERYPHVQFYFPTLNIEYKDKFRNINNVKVIDFFKISKVTSRMIYRLPKLYSQLFMRKFDAVVCIGGSIFMDKKLYNKKRIKEVKNYSFISDYKIAKKLGKPYFVIGANWGPCYNDFFFEFFNEAFNNIYDICFRDNYSYQLFASKRNVRKASDVLLSIDMDTTQKKDKQVSISVMDFRKKEGLQKYYRAYFDKILELVSFYQNKNYIVNLVSFCEYEGDEEVVDKVYSCLENKIRVNRIYYKNNYKEILEVLNNSSLIIASRFHSMILGWALKKPVFSIVYSNKMKNVINDIDENTNCNNYILLENIEKLNVSVTERVSVMAIKEVEKIKKDSARQFEKLDGLLK